MYQKTSLPEVESDTLSEGSTSGAGADAIGPLAQLRGNAFAQQQLASAAGSTPQPIQIEFMAFIPTWLGKPFKDTPAGQQSGFENQSEFDKQVAAVAGTWAPEPGQPLSTDEGAYYFSTDDRGFGGGSHRLRATIEVAPGESGLGSGKGTVKADCNASHQAYVDVDGWFSKSATVVQSAKVASPTNTFQAHSAGSDALEVSHTTGASYPFSSVAPNIDISGSWRIEKDPAGQLLINGSGEHNKFPFYEILVDGRSIYQYASPDTGPGLINLNSSLGWKVATKV